MLILMMLTSANGVENIFNLENKMIDFNNLKEGSLVVVRGDFGTGGLATVTIKDLENDGKNGRAIIDYINEDGDRYWAYLDQIKSVVKY